MLLETEARDPWLCPNNGNMHAHNEDPLQCEPKTFIWQEM